MPNSEELLAWLYVGSLQMARRSIRTGRRNFVLDGDYVYVNSHLVLNSPVYVGWRNPVTPYLRIYARLHADECFLKFHTVRKTLKIGDGSMTSNIAIEESFLICEPILSPVQSSGSSEEWREYLRGWRECRCKSAGETLEKILKMKNMSPEVFSGEVRVSPGFIRRICSGNRCPGMKTTMVIAGKLNMPYELIPWFTEMFNRHFFSNKPDTKPYLDAMRNVCVSDDEISAVRRVLENRIEKMKRGQQTYGRLGEDDPRR